MTLSICMPTYNRKDKALHQVQNIVNQCIGLDEAEIEYLISDNCSLDNTASYLIEQISELPFNVTIERQEKNLGLVGNLYYLFNKARGEYIWFISDDDIVYEGAVSSILELIKSNPRNFYMLNFKTEERGNVSADNYWLPNDNYLELFTEKTWGGFGLLSVQVLRRRLFVSLYSEKEIFNLCQPVAVSMYGLVQLQGIIDFSKPYVLHHVGDYSWQKESTKVGSIYLFQALQSLKDKTDGKNYKRIIDALEKCSSFCKSSVKYILLTKDSSYICQLFSEQLLFKIIWRGLWRSFLAKVR